MRGINEEHSFVSASEEILSESTVNHPKHYNSSGKEVIEHLFDTMFALGAFFCIGNVIKYELRAPHKGNLEEDLAKARWYYQYFHEQVKKRNRFAQKIWYKTASVAIRACFKEYPNHDFRII